MSILKRPLFKLAFFKKIKIALKVQNLTQMKAEIQLISPLVPVRVLKFIRFTKQQAEGMWIVVDLSIDSRMEGHITRRFPSGCILHDMPNGFTVVTWIEHTRYEEQSVSQQYRQLISSGVGFGAQRWISALLRHCQSLSAITSPALTTTCFMIQREA
ncbi:putative homeobox-leucine zipper protein GLAB [Helianthus anomalus]